MKPGRGIYDCGHVSFTTTRSARSKNWYNTLGKTKVRKRDRDINSIYMGEVKLVDFSSQERWFPRCGVQGKLKLLLGFNFIVSFKFTVLTHWNSACVSIASSKFLSLLIKLNYVGEKIRISLSLSFVQLSVYTTFLLHSMQFDQSENFFMDYVQGNLHVHVRLSEYTLQYFSNGWWRRRWECLILVNITMFCNRCKFY